MANDAHGGRRRPRKRAKRMGKGPDGQRDMDVDEDEEEEEVLSLVDIRARVLAAGFTEAQMQECLNEYETIDVWVRMANGSKLRFMSS